MPIDMHGVSEAPRSEEKGLRLGAYGLCFPDLPGAADLLNNAPQAWSDWHIAHSPAEGQPAEFVESKRARLRSPPNGWVELDLDNKGSTFYFPARPGDREIVHPYIGSTASVVAWWRGQMGFHCGAFVAGGRAWGVLGPKGAGKSSLLAYLALLDGPILTDDLLVIREGRGLAGPRCIDLRSEPASMLGAGEALGTVGTRERWRLRTEHVEPEVPMGGWIRLGWGEQTRLATIPADQRAQVLLGNIALRREPPDPLAFLDLLALPMLTLERPRKIDELASTADYLLKHATSIAT